VRKAKPKPSIIYAKIKHRWFMADFVLDDAGTPESSQLSIEKCDELNKTFPGREKKPGLYYEMRCEKGVFLVHENDLQIRRK